MRGRICGGVCFFPFSALVNGMETNGWCLDMVATEERKIAARQSAVKKQESKDKKAPASEEK
jgi:hypothetical protein